MRYFELFEDQTEIERVLKEFFRIDGIHIIHPDGTVDVEGDCELRKDKKVNQLPVKFGKVSGNFWCDNNQLISLEGAPQSVGGYFDCYDNRLTSLVGAPQSVGGDFYCSWSPTLPLLRTVVAKNVFIYKDNSLFGEITDILNSSIKDNPGSYRKAALDAKRMLIDAGFEGNAKW
jgi:hypothetical protein